MKPQSNRPPHPDHHTYIEAIRRGDESIFEEFYQIDLPAHTAWVCKNSGNSNDAFDNFQDAMEVIIKKVNDCSFILYFPFRLYLHGVCHKLWYKKLKKRVNEKKMIAELVRKMQEEEHINIDDFEKLIIETIDGKKQKWQELLERTFQKISPLCQKLLTFDKEGKKIVEIKDELDMKASTIHKRRHDCKSSWRKAMENDPDFNNSNPFDI